MNKPATAKPVVKQFVPARYFTIGRGGVPISRIVLHYTDGPDAAGALRWWQMEHDNPGSAHYVIDRNGDLYQAVKDEDKAWHARNANPESIGIEFVAVQGQTMSAEQAATGAQLVHWLVETYGIPWARINGHRFTPSNAGFTDCPNNLFGALTESAVLAWVDGVRRGETPVPVHVPDEGDTLREGMPWDARVKVLQERLTAKGFTCGRPDGWFGPNTARALRAWQASVGLVGTGTADETTRTQLAVAS